MGASITPTCFFMIMSIDVFSHGIRVYDYPREALPLLADFSDLLRLKKPRKLPPNEGGYMVMDIHKKYYGLRHDKREVFFHRHSLDDLLQFLERRGNDLSRVSVSYIDAPVPDKAEYLVKPHFIPREEQVPIIEAIVDKVPKRRETLLASSIRVDLHTGGGKTFSALKALSILGVKSVIMVAPKYFGIWMKALKDTYEGFTDDVSRVATVSGTPELKMTIDMALQGTLEADILIISNVTYRAYIEAYERYGDDLEGHGFGVPPPRFHELIGAGYQINDEYQDDPGLVFRIDIYTNIKRQVYLSATPFTGDDFVTGMINHMVPEECKCKIPSPDCYIDVVALYYSDMGLQQADYKTPYKGTYNHARYETQMVKKKKRLNHYLSLVRKMVNGLYYQDRQPKQKMLILCATVDFIRIMVKYLNIHFPDLKIGEKVAGTPYDKFLSQDITVSTPKSAGTGVDIPNLRETLMLVATDSKKDNIQILGRLRHLKDYPDHTPRFTYAVCDNIPQHRKYAVNKLTHFSGRVKSHRKLRL